MSTKKVHSIGGADASGTDANVLKIEQEGGIGMQVSGSGAWTLVIEATMEDPSEADAVWISAQATSIVDGSSVTSFSAAGAARIDLPGFGGVRLRQSAGAGTPTSWLGETLENV